jgi:NAD(P)H dehydrogenase (quinone)
MNSFNSSARIGVTGATGQLGGLVLEHLLQHTAASDLVAFVRDPAKADGLRARGVEVRAADYSQPESWDSALAGIDRLLLISSNEIGRRTQQHRNVIEAAARRGVKRIAYTSVLHADTSELHLALEHRDTEAAIHASGLPFVLLRNGWYTENYLASVPAALAQGAFHGAAGEGRLSLASRNDYALAAALALGDEVQAGTTLELAGSQACTLSEFVSQIALIAAREVRYVNLSESDYRQGLITAGLPEAFAGLLAQSDAAAARGALFDDGRTLERLIGRPTTPIADAITRALRG